MTYPNPRPRAHRETLTHQVYRTYLIRWSVFTLDKPDNRYWVEKDQHFICWAQSVDDARAKINKVLE